MTLYMPLFKSCTTLRSLTQLHGHLTVTGLLHADPLPSTKLIESYAQMNTLQSSTLVFQAFQKPDPFMWGVLIKSHVWNHHYEEAISIYHRMTINHSQISSFVFPSVLRACAGFDDLGIGEKIHGRIIKSGFDHDPIIETSLLCMYSEARCVYSARKLFDEMLIRDLVSWSTIISCYINNGEVSQGLNMFRVMVSGFEPDSVILLSVVEACAEFGCLRLGKSIHCQIITRSIDNGGFLDNSLVMMYSKCDDLFNAEKIFLNCMNKTTTSWTTMLSSYNRAHCFEKALETFFEMLESNFEPNSVTFTTVLSSCAMLGRLRDGKLIHSVVIKQDMDPDNEYVGPTLVELYARCGKLRESRNVLSCSISKRNIVSWNTLISIYAQRELFNEALVLFVDMLIHGLNPDSFSLASVLSACGNVGSVVVGNQIHGRVIKTGVSHEFVGNSLVDMYSKCGFPDLGYLIFEKIEPKSVVTWNSMICGFSKNGDSVKAINLFDEMFLNRVEMNDVTFLSVIQACSDLGDFRKGKWVHHKIVTYGIINKNDLFIDTAITDMYAKCGDLQTARRVFDSITEKSVVSWSAMIYGYGIHSRINDAVALFTRMVDSGIKPNEVTFMNMLSACSHSGSVSEGRFYFRKMRDFGVDPTSEHFACMVDILSRAGEVDEAYGIIKSMPFRVDASVWSALINGCRIHRRIDVIGNIEKDILGICTDDSGYYTLLSNVFAEEGKWDEFRKMRSTMDSIGVKKVAGYSTI